MDQILSRGCMQCKSADYSPAYSLRDTVGSKVIFTVGFQPPCLAILRKHTLHSHLIWKLCRFHGARYQGKQGEEARKRKRRNKQSCCSELVLFYASKALLSKVGEGSGNEGGEVGEFFNRRFLDLARVIKPNAPQPTTHINTFSPPLFHPSLDFHMLPIILFIFSQTHSHRFYSFSFQMKNACLATKRVREEQ